MRYLSLYLRFHFPLQIFPSQIPDLSSDGPVVISGRCRGSFPDSFKAKGVLANSGSFEIDLKVHNAKDIPLDKVQAPNDELSKPALIVVFGLSIVIVVFFFCGRLLQRTRSNNSLVRHGFQRINSSRIRYFRIILCYSFWVWGSICSLVTKRISCVISL